MKILAIETATRRQSVALVEHSRLLGERVHEDCPSHTRMLLPTIDALLHSLHLTLAKVEGIAVSMGPGSFTGLRVGLSTAMGVRLARGLPLVGVSTLEALAWNLRGVEGRICPMIRSRVGVVYWAQFEWRGGQLLRLSPDRAGSLSHCAESITAPVWVFGDGWLGSQPDLMTLLGSHAKPVDPGHQQASAVSLALASEPHFHAGNFLPVGASPAYVQPSQAEVQWDQRHGSARDQAATS